MDLAQLETFNRLCAAIDRDDIKVLPILADLMEDAGLPLVNGLRKIAPWQEPSVWPSATQKGPVYGWRVRHSPGSGGFASISERVWNRLPSPILETRGGTDWAFYLSPSLAYLALAEALSQE